MMRRVQPPSDRPLNAEDLARYLFGARMDPNDTGLIGRILGEIKQVREDMSEQVAKINDDTTKMRESTQRQVRGVLMLGWAILVVLVAALLTLVGNLIVHILPAGVRP